jgi:hypothetical protein
MDPATLAAGAIALLVTFLKAAGTEFAEEGGKAAWRLASRLLDRIRSSVKNRPPEREVLEAFTDNADGSTATMREMLRRRLEEDRALAVEVNEILQEVKQLGPSLFVVQRIKEAEDAVGVEARRIRSGSVEVNQEIERGKNITGVRIEDDLG